MEIQRAQSPDLQNDQEADSTSPRSAPSSPPVQHNGNDWIEKNKQNNRAVMHTLPESRKESLTGCEELIKQGLISVEDPERIYELTEILGKG